MTIKDTDIITKTKLNLGNFNINLPNTFLPNPTDKDYKVGYIERYVVSKINYNEITEVSSDVYSKMDSNFFKKAKFKWKITGVLNNKYDGKMLLQQGVIEFNKKQVEQINTIIRGVNDVFSNLTQFYKQTN
jgi:phage pi2 protein 07